jgi:formylglycine-generating enzyme required for sulfatase activity
MHGNVLERFEDCYHSNYYGAPADGSPWTAIADCNVRLVRGGSWLNNPLNLRSASRVRILLRRRSYDPGFRVARTLTPWILASLHLGSRAKLVDFLRVPFR